METATRSTLLTIAGQLAAIVGMVHLGLGTFYSAGGPGAIAGDPRVIVWTAAGVALVGGVAVSAAGWYHPRLCSLGAGLVGLLLAAHLLWPAVVGGALYLGAAPGPALADPAAYTAAVLFAANPIAKVLVALEIVLLTALVMLVFDRGPH